ncbi:hypothetical protein ACWDOP_14035 [Nocardia sp. NPDC003693]
MADESEYLANVRSYVTLMSEGKSPSNETVILSARGVRWRGGDPVRLTRQLDGYADEIGQSQTMIQLRGAIVADWNAEEEDERRSRSATAASGGGDGPGMALWVGSIVVAVVVLTLLLSQCS